MEIKFSNLTIEKGLLQIQDIFSLTKCVTVLLDVFWDYSCRRAALLSEKE